jgi:hypothetical protein
MNYVVGSEGGGSSGVFSASGRKYGGLIEEGTYKQFYRRISAMVSYVYTVSPTFEVVEAVVTFFRLLQFVGPCLCAGYAGHWSDLNAARTLVEALAIFWHIVPAFVADEGCWVTSLICAILTVVTLLFFFACSIYVEKTATLPSFVPSFFSIWTSAFGFLVHPVAVHAAGHDLGRWFSGADIPQKVVVLFSAFFALAASAAYIFVYCNVLGRTLQFRPTPLMTTAIQPAAVFFVIQVTISFVIGVGECQIPVGRAAAMFVTAVLYCLALPIISLYGGFVSPRHTTLFATCAVTGAVFMIWNGVLALIETQAEILELVIFAGVWLLGLIVITWIQNAIVSKRLALLDWILDEPDKMEDIPSIASYVNLCIEGFRASHPVCIDWSLPTWATEAWPEEEMPWFFYAKFVAIFPEQSQTLSCIYRTLMAN